ncbi:hypothetical protein MPLA_1140005 [Mesorhizobium sp. ORS 3359]|nr:hypothetical protein MPLA_1140005 [Mesorhizobium sp. ORS 3359]
MALAIFAAQRFELAAIVTHVRFSSACLLAALPARTICQASLLPGWMLPPFLRISRLLKLFRAKVSGSGIEKSIDIVRVFIVRKSHKVGARHGQAPAAAEPAPRLRGHGAARLADQGGG